MLAFLFPGQGSYLPGSLADLSKTESRIAQILQRIDQCSGADAAHSVTSLLLQKDAPALEALVAEAPDALHMAIFASEIVLFDVLTHRHGLQPDILVGHSYGELMALVCAGVYSLEDGVKLVAARNRALQEFADRPGGMLAVAASAERVEALLAAMADGSVQIAADNSPNQCVLSGPDTALARVQEVAGTLRWPATRLRVRYPFHHRMLAPAARAFAKATAALPTAPASYRVYSPIMGGMLADGREIADLVAAHMTRPTGFRTALHALQAQGVGTFVECGVRGTLVDLVEATLVGSRTIAPLRNRVDASGLSAALDDLPRLDAPRPSFPAGSDAAATTAPPNLALEETLADQTAVQSVAPPGDGALLAQLQQMYAGALGYPTDVLTPEADLEADLGIDSIKQNVLFEQALAHHGLAGTKEHARKYPTLGEIVELIRRLSTKPMPSGINAHAGIPSPLAGTGRQPPSASIDRPAQLDATPLEAGMAEEPRTGQRNPVSPHHGSLPSHGELVAQLQEAYAVALGYPAEVLTSDADLEADLGIDSIKQNVLFAQALERHGLADAKESARKYPTLGEIAELLLRLCANTPMPAQRAAGHRA